MCAAPTCLPSLKTRGYVDSDMCLVLVLWNHRLSYRVTALTEPSSADCKIRVSSDAVQAWKGRLETVARRRFLVVSQTLSCRRKPWQPTERLTQPMSVSVANLACGLANQHFSTQREVDQSATLGKFGYRSTRFQLFVTKLTRSTLSEVPVLNQNALTTSAFEFLTYCKDTFDILVNKAT